MGEDAVGVHCTWEVAWGVAGWDGTSLLSHSNSFFFFPRDQKGNQENREKRASLARR